MISIASCGYFVVTSECSASAVVFASPHVPRSSIEYDMSTSSATAALARRSVSTTSKSSAVSWSGLRPVRSTALRTVRTTSRGCSSPNRHSRLAPVRRALKGAGGGGGGGGGGAAGGWGGGAPAGGGFPAPTPPLATGAGPLTGRPGVPPVVPAAPARLDHREDPAQRRAAQAT